MSRRPKLTEERRQEMVARYCAGESPTRLAEEFGVTANYVHRLMHDRGIKSNCDKRCYNPTQEEIAQSTAIFRRVHLQCKRKQRYRRGKQRQGNPRAYSFGVDRANNLIATPREA